MRICEYFCKFVVSQFSHHSLTAIAMHAACQKCKLLFLNGFICFGIRRDTYGKYANWCN